MGTGGIRQGEAGWREEVLGEMTRIGGHGERVMWKPSLVETQDSTRVTLERLLVMGDLEPSVAILCNQASILRWDQPATKPSQNLSCLQDALGQWRHRNGGSGQLIEGTHAQHCLDGQELETGYPRDQ